MDVSRSKRGRRRHRKRSKSNRDRLTNKPKNQPAVQTAPVLPSQTAAALAVSRSEFTAFSGPIPPPDLLKQYDEIEPGRAARLLNLAEDQSRHRMELEKKIVDSDIRRSWAGLAGGLVVCLAVVAVGALAVTQSQAVAGSTMIVGAITALAGCFVYGTRSQRIEREHKAALMSVRKNK